MRTYVSTLGFHATRVTRPVLSHGIDTGDQVVLLRPAGDSDDDGRADEEIEDIRRTLGQVAPEIDVTVEHLTHDDFATAVRECLDVLLAAQGDVIPTFGGGPRELFLPFTIAVLTVQGRMATAFQFNDIDGSVRTLDLPDFTTPIGDPVFETLQAVDRLDGETTLPELAATVDRSKSTVGRHLDDLEAAGAVETDLQGKTRHVTLTLGGELRVVGRA